MDVKGMVIEGKETIFTRDTHKAKGQHFLQRWLCKMPGQPAVLNTQKLLQRSAERLKKQVYSGFDPQDD